MNKKCLFLSELYSPLIGGSCVMFAGRFQHCDPQKIVVLTKCVPQSEIFDQKQSYRIVRIPMTWRGFKGFEWLGIVKDLVLASIPLIRQFRIDTIECARPLPEGIAGLFLSTLLRKKLVVNYHGEDISVLQHYRVERILLRLLARRANLNLANSQYTKQLVENLAGSKIKIATIFPGFSPEKLNLTTPLLDNPLKDFLSNKKPIILTIGRLQRRKGQDNVIKAMPQIIQKFPNAQYLIVGSAQGGNQTLYKEMQDLIDKYHLQNNVSIIGEVEDQYIPYFYQNCDIFIMANRKENNDIEGFGIVFLEAGYFEKPAIGGKVGGSTDAIQDGKTGYLVDGENVDEIAQKMIELLSDEEKRNAFGKAGKEFGAQLTHQKLSLLYQQKLGAHYEQ